MSAHLTDCLNRLPRAVFSRLRPVVVQGREVGWVTAERRDVLLRMNDLFREAEGGGVAPHGPRSDTERVLAEAVRRLSAQGHLKLFEPERFPVPLLFGAAPVTHVDRAAVTWLGMLSRGVHLNGWFRRDGEIWMWLGRRAPTLTHFPDEWDNMCAGGWPASKTARTMIIEEADEEAGVDAVAMNGATCAGLVSYDLAEPRGIRREAITVFDLQVAPDFTPVNSDGMVCDFKAVSASEVLAWLRRGGDGLKYNTRYVLLDFLLRHGLIDPDTEPGYERIRPALMSPRSHRAL